MFIVCGFDLKIDNVASRRLLISKVILIKYKIIGFIDVSIRKFLSK